MPLDRSGELAKLVPPKLSLTDVLDRLRKRLVEQQAKGVTVAQMHEVFESQALKVHVLHAGPYPFDLSFAVRRSGESADVSAGLRACCIRGGKEGCRGRQVSWCRKKAGPDPF